MLPYWARLSVRGARVALSLAVLASAGFTAASLAYFLYSLALLSDWRYKFAWRSWLTLAGDTAFFALWRSFAPQIWLPPVAGCLLLASALLSDDALQAAIGAVAAAALSWFAPPAVAPRLTAIIGAAAALAVIASIYQRYLRQRISLLLGQSVAIRSQAQQARDAERERIAADFHDGPLQNFIGFQMRLEIVRKLLARGDFQAATDETVQLQQLARGQLADLRSFARSMRPPDEGLSLCESLNRLAVSFQRDTGLVVDSSISDIPEPDAATGLEILQIVRETLHNVAKHSGASRVALSAAKASGGLRIAVEDNGSGFPFSGVYNLEELDRQSLGPISIKRRIRLLNGRLRLASQPGQGASLEITVPQ